MESKEKELKELSGHLTNKLKRTTRFFIWLSFIVAIAAFVVFGRVILTQLEVREERKKLEEERKHQQVIQMKLEKLIELREQELIRLRAEIQALDDAFKQIKRK